MMTMITMITGHLHTLYVKKPIKNSLSASSSDTEEKKRHSDPCLESFYPKHLFSCPHVLHQVFIHLSYLLSIHYEKSSSASALDVIQTD